MGGGGGEKKEKGNEQAKWERDFLQSTTHCQREGREGGREKRAAIS